MTARLRHLWKTQRAAVIVFVIVLAVTLGLALRSILFAVYWSDPAHRDQAVEPWMTPRYVAHSWKIPPDVVRAALGDAMLPGRGQTIGDIAEARGLSETDLIAAIEAAIDSHRGGTGQ